MAFERIKHFDMREHTHEQATKMVRSLTLAIEGQAKLNAPVDTGELRASINAQSQGLDGSVGTNVKYAPHVEYGTVRMAPQPYLRTAVDEVAKRVREMWGV